MSFKVCVQGKKSSNHDEISPPLIAIGQENEKFDDIESVFEMDRARKYEVTNEFLGLCISFIKAWEKSRTEEQSNSRASYPECGDG